MKYYEVEDVLDKPGLRLVLTVGLPGPWGLAAKALFDFKGIDYIAAAQHPGGDNRCLQDISGQTAAPVALYGSERPVVSWNEMIYLAERLGPGKPLVPADCLARTQMFGWVHEIVGPQGFGWSRRLQMLAPMMQTEDPGPLMADLSRKYGYSDSAATEAADRCKAILAALGNQLHAQKKAGSDYLVGDKLSAADIYWAIFASFIQPLDQDVNPMPPGMRELYTAPAAIADAADSILLAHRDMMYQRHLALPLDYLATD